MEAEDPLEICATPVPGDPRVMLECFIQEYAAMGWNAGQIFDLFSDPSYPALHGLLRAYGETFLRHQITTSLGRTGVFCCEGTVVDEPEPNDEEEFVELGVPARWKGKGHA
jgi:hypothetical protein